MCNWILSIIGRKPVLLPLPPVFTVEDIQNVLSQIKVIPERLWSLPDPEAVWAKKQSGCMGFCAITRKLLISIGKEDVQAIKILCYRYTETHAITVWKENGIYQYFSNSNLRNSETDNLDTLCLNLKREQFKKYEVL